MVFMSAKGCTKARTGLASDLRWKEVWHDEQDLDPVTRLDVNPATPFELYPADTVQLWLLRARTSGNSAP